jgi:hypothetical protein
VASCRRKLSTLSRNIQDTWDLMEENGGHLASYRAALITTGPLSENENIWHSMEEQPKHFETLQRDIKKMACYERALGRLGT